MFRHRATRSTVGDTAIRLLDDLYATDCQGHVVAPLVVKPTDSTLIGGVVGVFTSQAVAESGDLFDLTRSDNLYAAVEAPFKVGDTVIRLKSSLSNPPAVGTSNLYIVYVPKKAYVKYSDVRYTHQLAGMAQQPDGPYYTDRAPPTTRHPVGTRVLWIGTVSSISTSLSSRTSASMRFSTLITD